MQVPDAAWGAAITGGFLLAQNWLNSRRHDRLSRLDREFGTTQLWSERRLSAHTRLIASFENYVGKTVFVKDQDGTQIGGAILELGELDEQMDAWATVDLLAGHRCRIAAFNARKNLLKLDHSIRSYNYEPVAPVPWILWLSERKALTATMFEYREAVRVELRTSDQHTVSLHGPSESRVI